MLPASRFKLASGPLLSQPMSIETARSACSRATTAILIRRTPVRKLGVVVGAVALLVGPSPASADDAGATGATMSCERVDGPGRVRCEVDAHVGPGESITWGDVVLQKTPPFATALRGRTGPHEATTREPGHWTWALALVARERGTGTVEGLVRLVACRGSACAPREVPVTATVVAGP